MSAGEILDFLVPPPAACIGPTAEPDGGASPAPAVRAAERPTVRQAGAQAPANGAPAPVEPEGQFLFVPVAFVARDWKVTPRRIRLLLSEKRLEGRRQANGYWEVLYPYRFTFGQRGPALKRSRKPERSAA